MIIEGEDGETHINIYSRGQTQIGRWLSNFTCAPVETVDGHFKSIEGYWYWLKTGHKELRKLYGYEAKKFGRKHMVEEDSELFSDELFQEKIKAAIDIKLKLRPKDISKITLPLCHYYEYSGHRVDAGYEWIVHHIEKRAKQLKEYYDKK